MFTQYRLTEYSIDINLFNKNSQTVKTVKMNDSLHDACANFNCEKIIAILSDPHFPVSPFKYEEDYRKFGYSDSPFKLFLRSTYISAEYRQKLPLIEKIFELFLFHPEQYTLNGDEMTFIFSIGSVIYDNDRILTAFLTSPKVKVFELYDCPNYHDIKYNYMYRVIIHYRKFNLMEKFMQLKDFNVNRVCLSEKRNSKGKTINRSVAIIVPCYEFLSTNGSYNDVAIPAIDKLLEHPDIRPPKYLVTSPAASFVTWNKLLVKNGWI